MGSRQTLQRWMITVGGVEQARVGAGQSVEIGRKPIRPLREDGFMRVDIVDNKRSMSKRHALLIVDTSGVATIRDLHSTNGTYLVNESGDLLRLDPDVDFHMPDSIVRMQFGDVPIDFVRIEEPVPLAENSAEPVRDLFSYAADGSIKEPDASDLSVDDILDIRAGEPTGVFRAQSVSHPNLVWDNQSKLNAAGKADDVYSASKADISVNPVKQSDPVIASQVVLPVVREDFESAAEPRNLFDDAAQANASQVNAAQASSDKTNSDETVNPDNIVDNSAVAGNAAISDNSVVANDSFDSHDVQDDSKIQYSQNVDVENENHTTQDQNTEQEEIAEIQINYQDENELQDGAEDESPATDDSLQDEPQIQLNHEQFIQSNSVNIQEDSQYTPAFEPGSVFEKVSNGEFNAHKEIVQAGGFTSEEAQKTTDFSKQFEIAKYQELLPFLAMNTGLYDDLYAWLSAQGNADVDEALAQNSGYNAYRNAVGL